MICNEIWIIENERGDICMFAIAVSDLIDRPCWLLSQYWATELYIQDQCKAVFYYLWKPKISPVGKKHLFLSQYWATEQSSAVSSPTVGPLHCNARLYFIMWENPSQIQF